jgi:hypothetical protein
MTQVDGFDTEGQEREDRLPMFPPPRAALGVGVAGEYVGHDTFTVQDKDDAGNVTGSRTVPFIKLRNVVNFTPNEDGKGGKLSQLLAVGVPINADARTKLDPDTLPAGCFLHIVLRERDPQYNNMNRYTVKIISREAWQRLYAASNQ